MNTSRDIDPERFAAEWVAAWNRRDAEAVLAHYADDAVFVSPKAAVVTGHAEVRGKAALRTYWSAALSRSTSLRFSLDRALWDPRARTIAVVYESQIDDRRVRACEVMRFGDDGLVARGEALYGASLA